MLIGELAERTGLTRDTIRFYEKRGLISLDGKTRRKNNYKEYSEPVLEQLKVIVKLKEMSFTLNEINTFLELRLKEDASCGNLRYTLENKIILVNEQIQKLTDFKSRLSGSLKKCNNNDCEFENTIPSLK